MDGPSPAGGTEPPVAARLFGPQVETARRYAALLGTAGIARGLLGPREECRLWQRHLLQGAVVAQLLPPAGPVVDVGSGAGLPGIPIALARPDLAVVLLDAAARRTAFLEEAVQLLGLEDRVSVRRARLEELPRGEQFPVLTARAVAPVARLVSWCRPRLEPQGKLFAIIGTEAMATAVSLGAQLHQCGLGVLEEPLTVAEFGRR